MKENQRTNLENQLRTIFHDELIWIAGEGTIVWDSAIESLHPNIDLGVLLTIVEDNLVEDDDEWSIDGESTKTIVHDYLIWAEANDPDGD